MHDFEIICPKRGCERIPRTPSAYGPELHFQDLLPIYNNRVQWVFSLAGSQTH